MQRREFLTLPAAAAAAPAVASQSGPRFRKGICSGIFRDGAMTFAEKFRRVREAGFEGIEMRVGDEIRLDLSPDELKRISGAAADAKVEIISVWTSDSRTLSGIPLNSPDPQKRAQGVTAVKRGIDIAAQVGCGAMLLVPGRLGAGPKMQARYEETWQRVTEALRSIIPHAAERKVVVTPENVWNKFLVSPLEMRTFIDQFKSPWFQAHFDIGNVMQFGYPQDWILTLGPRIKRVHAKDYKLSTRAEQGRFVDLLQGDVDWKEVMAALVKVGYRGFISPEVTGDIIQVSKALDRILEMA